MKYSFFLVFFLFGTVFLKGQNPCYLDSVYINALLVDPSGSDFNFDTNGDGLINSNDEFVEICNASQDTVDVSNWRIGDDDPPPFPDFAIGDNMTIPPGECLLIVANYCPTLPSEECSTPSGVLNMGYTFSGFLGNAGDVVSIVNPTGNSCSVVYGSTVCSQIDELDIPDFDPDNCDDWGGDTDGCPLLALGVDCDYEPVVLPISLLNFEAKLVENDVVALEWRAVESATFFKYELEWTNNLDAGFENIAIVDSDEANQAVKSYDYEHLLPQVGYNFYRLKSISQSGSFVYSKILVVEIKSKHSFEIYPTVVESTFEVKSSDNNYRMQVFDMAGRLVMANQLHNTITELDITHLNQGFYIVRLEAQNFDQSFKIVKI